MTSLHDPGDAATDGRPGANVAAAARSRGLRLAALLIGAAVLGVVLAFVAGFWFFLGSLVWLNLVLWAVIAVALGAALRSWFDTIAACAILGFSIVVSYSILGYGGVAPLATVLPAFGLFGIFGAIGMTAGGSLGHLLRRLRRRPTGTRAGSASGGGRLEP